MTFTPMTVKQSSVSYKTGMIFPIFYEQIIHKNKHIRKKTKLAALSIVPQQNCKVLLKILENSENIFTNNKDIAISRLQICNSACKSVDSSNSPQV